MLDKKYYVNVGPQGTFRKSGNYQTTPADVDQLFDSLEQANERRIALYFHGGLIDEDLGMRMAAGVNWYLRWANVHPVSFVWESGLLETIAGNLGRIHRTKLFEKVLKYVTRKLSERSVSEGKGNAATLTFADIDAELAADGVLTQLEQPLRDFAQVQDERKLAQLEKEMQQELAKELAEDTELPDVIEKEVPVTDLLNADFKRELATKGEGAEASGWFKLAWAMARIAYRILKRFLKKRDHGFHATLVEEILRELYIDQFGDWVWGGMKTIGDQMWHDNTGRVGDDQYAGRYFIEKLGAYQAKYPDTTIDVVGHSAGAVLICEMLKHVAKDGLGVQLRNIVFYAAAATQELVNREIVDHPTRFDSFRSFTMHDYYEKKDILVPKLPFLYPSSLLYLISGVLENNDGGDEPISGMHRYYTKQKPYHGPAYVQHADFMAQPDFLVLSPTSFTNPTAKPGFICDCITHGGFSGNRSTLISTKDFLKS